MWETRYFIHEQITNSGYVIENNETNDDNWICGLVADKSDNEYVGGFLTDKIIVNLKQYHLLDDQYRHKISQVHSMELPVGGFQAIVLDYEGKWDFE